MRRITVSMFIDCCHLVLHLISCMNFFFALFLGILQRPLKQKSRNSTPLRLAGRFLSFQDGVLTSILLQKSLLLVSEHPASDTNLQKNNDVIGISKELISMITHSFCRSESNKYSASWGLFFRPGEYLLYSRQIYHHTLFHF